MTEYTLNFDGSCGPKNPGGTAAYGFTLKLDGDAVDSGHGVIGTGDGMTNNLAEFVALAKGLEAFSRLHVTEPCKINIIGDSTFVLDMMTGRWQAKEHKAYYPGFVQAKAALRPIRLARHIVSFEWVGRAKNQECDDLSKAHLTK
jgi:ribonuclease HI